MQSEQTIYDVVIIGGGPAGYSSALYTSRAKLKTLVIDSASVLGQMAMTDHIENYPGFPEGVSGGVLLEKQIEQAKMFETEIVTGMVETLKKDANDTWRVITTENEYIGLSIIVATGAGNRMLGIAGEKELRGRGVSYCATCDGPFFRNRELVVVGGGDSAVEEAMFLTKFASKVTVVHRRDRLRATQILQDRAFANDKIEFVWDSKVTEITGKMKVESVKLENLKTGGKTELTCQGVFIFIGFIPNTQLLEGVVDLDDTGYVIEDILMRTSEKSIFVAGDCRKDSFRQIITACGDGASAALSAQHYVEALKGTAYL